MYETALVPEHTQYLTLSKLFRHLTPCSIDIHAGRPSVWEYVSPKNSADIELI